MNFLYRLFGEKIEQPGAQQSANDSNQFDGFQTIIHELSQPARITDMPRRVQLCETALKQLERAQNPTLWAALQGTLGNNLTQNPQGLRADNLERAIAAYEQALHVQTRQAMPVEWATTTNNLATAYIERIRGERVDNLERAIELNEQALQVRTHQVMPAEWATTTNNLATAYYVRIRGERADNLERAIAAYEQALQVRTYQAMPVAWAETTSNLANAYKDRIRGEHAENLERAIALNKQVVQVMTRQTMPVEWAKITNNLANIYTERIRGERADNLERAIEFYEQALQVRTHQVMPAEWAQTTTNLANAYANRVRGERADNLEHAIALNEQALQVMTRQAMPFEWALTTNNMANVYNTRIRGERADNLERAIEFYQQALQVRTRQAMPLEWSETTTNLASTYQERIRGERADNLEQAITGYEQALQIRTHQAMPVGWAFTTMNLANAYAERIRGERADNLERAIELNEQALQVMTRQTMPNEWAITTMNLANAYKNRIRSERAENLERAIELNQQALQVMTRQTLPIEWAQATMNLASAYKDRVYGERAENLERTIELNEQALQIRTHEAMPVDWAQTTNNLATAYAERIRGERAENLERAIELNEQALQVRTRQTMPIEWAQTTLNLANAYYARIRGERAENLERAIELNEQALQVRTRQTMPIEWAQTTNNLANAYKNRIRGKRAENLERAIELNEQALQVMTRQAMPVEWAITTMNLASAYAERIHGERPNNLERAIAAYIQTLAIFKRDTFPDDHRYLQNRLGDLYFQQGAWAAAATAFAAALQVGENLYQTAATPEARQGELGKLRGLPMQLAYALLKNNPVDTAIGQEAVLAVERNRARWLSESLAMRTAKPSSVPDEFWQRFIGLGQQIQKLQAESRLPETTPAKRGYLVLSELLRAAYAELAETLAQIRVIAPDFMPEPSFANLQTAAQGAPLVYLLTTEAGGLALIVQVDKVTPIWLDFKASELDEMLFTSSDGTKRHFLEGSAGGDEDALRTTLDWALPRLGEQIMGPLAAVLRGLVASVDEKRRVVTLIPTGNLSLLPLHAARYEVNGQIRCFLDEFAVTYAPSAQALTVAQQRPVTAQRRLLALGNPVGQETHPALFTDWLANEVSLHFQAEPPLMSAQASGQAFRKALAQQMPQHLLFGCHGAFNPEDPLRSGLELADGQLTLADLLDDVRLDGCDLVTLCACQTAITDFNHVSDEAIGLPAALLLAGARRVVGTLWSVHALPTVLLLRHFYEQVANGAEPVYALRSAVHWLRALPQAEAKAALAQLKSYADAKIIRGLGIQLALEGAQPFAAPVYWAAFTYTGALSTQRGTIPHYLVAELIDSNVLMLPANTLVQAAHVQAQGGQMLVVMSADGYPCGLLTAEALAGLQDAGQVLADAAEQWLVPTLTVLDTPLEMLVQGMLAEPAIEWYVVMNGPQVIGVVGPQTIQQTLTRLKEQPSSLAPVSELIQRIIDLVASAAPDTLSLPPGNPILPRAPICYRCPGGGAPHRVEQEQVLHSVSGIPLCPEHVGTRVVPLNPCGVI